jgi:hypothetical protein
MSSTQKMSVKEWIAVEDNPIQRDTERHARKARHLLTPKETHAIVFAGRLPSGKLIKLDGHTRALLWARGQVEPPAVLTVNVIPIASRDEAVDLYKTFDSQQAVEIASDKVTGGFREMGFKPQSSLVASGSLSAALRIATITAHGWQAQKSHDTYQMIDEFSAEILALDDLNLRRGAAHSAFVAAFFLSYRKHDVLVMPFWRSVFANGGTKLAGEMDGVQAVTEMMLKVRAAGINQSMELCGRALMAVEKWLAGSKLSAMPRPVDLMTYLAHGPELKAQRKKAPATNSLNAHQ